MFLFHQFLKESEPYADPDDWYAGESAWPMAIALKEFLQDAGEYAEIAMPVEPSDIPVYVKVWDKVYSMAGEQPAEVLGQRFKVLGESATLSYAKEAGIDEANMASDLKLRKKVILSAVEKAIAHVREQGIENFDDGLYESRMLRARAQGFDTTTVMYHETDKDNKIGILENGFDLGRIGARRSDIVPNGVFLKPTKEKIHVADNPVQIPLLVKKTRSAKFKNRGAIFEYLREDPIFKDLHDKVEEIDSSYAEIADQQTSELDRIIIAHGRKDPRCTKLREDISNHLKDWREVANQAAEKARERSTQIFSERGIGVIEIKEDEGSFGRTVSTTIVLDPSHVRFLTDDFHMDRNKEVSLNAEMAIS